MNFQKKNFKDCCWKESNLGSGWGKASLRPTRLLPLFYFFSTYFLLVYSHNDKPSPLLPSTGSI